MSTRRAIMNGLQTTSLFNSDMWKECLPYPWSTQPFLFKFEIRTVKCYLTIHRRQDIPDQLMILSFWPIVLNITTGQCILTTDISMAFSSIHWKHSTRCGMNVISSLIFFWKILVGSIASMAVSFLVICLILILITQCGLFYCSQSLCYRSTVATNASSVTRSQKLSNVEPS